MYVVFLGESEKARQRTLLTWTEPPPNRHKPNVLFVASRETIVRGQKCIQRHIESIGEHAFPNTCRVERHWGLLRLGVHGIEELGANGTEFQLLRRRSPSVKAVVQSGL